MTHKEPHCMLGDRREEGGGKGGIRHRGYRVTLTYFWRDDKNGSDNHVQLLQAAQLFVLL